MAARTGRVTRVTVDGRVYVELSDVAPGFEFGPVLDTVGGLTVGDRVITTGLARDPDALVVIGLLDPAPSAPLVHTHHADDVVDGVLALNRLPVAPSGNANPTQLVRADDARLSDARTPTAHTHDDRYYTEAEVTALLAAKANDSQPFISAVAAAAQSIPTGAWTRLNQWSQRYTHASIPIAGADYWTVNQAGLYDIRFEVMFQNQVSSAGVRGAAIYINNINIAGYYAPPIVGQGDYASSGTQTLYRLDPGYTIGFWVLQNAGGNINTHGAPWTQASIRRVGA